MKCEICGHFFEEKIHLVGSCKYGHTTSKTFIENQIEIRFQAYPPLKKAEDGSLESAIVCYGCQYEIVFGVNAKRYLSAAVDDSNKEK